MESASLSTGSKL